MIKVSCVRCMKELKEQGGILLSPPRTNLCEVGKYHLCVRCYDLTVAGIVGKTLRIKRKGKK